MKREEDGDRREGETEEGRREGEEMKGRETQITRQDGLMEGTACIASYLSMYSIPRNISVSHGKHKLTHPCTQPTLLQHHPGGIHVH